MKSLARRACFSKGSVRAVEVYKAKVASLTLWRADLRAQVRHLTKDATKHRYDLKYTSTAKSQAEEHEKKAQDELRAAAYELRMVKDELRVVRVEQQADKEELQVARDELRLKTTTLSGVCQEVTEVESTVGRLNEECHGLRDDLQRQRALVS